jgi:hypothetical protein
MILDHDSKYGAEVFASMHAMNITAVRTAVACPWQNGVAPSDGLGAVGANCWIM